MSGMEQNLSTFLHYGNWYSVLGWFIIFGTFIAFLPYHRKSRTKPRSMYVAFVLASALEMFGIPLSMYFIAWAFGVTVPRGVLWGHTLEGMIGYWGMYIGVALNVVGGALIQLGWRAVYQRYWSREEGERELVTDGVYGFSRHPQYAGFILMTLGLLVHWATLPLLIMWPILLIQYYRLAKSEEETMEAEFGEEYLEYKRKVPMFVGIPK